MSEEQNIEQRQQDRKTESVKKVNENISQEQTIKQPETTNPKSEIQKSEIENMEVHHHPDLHHRKKHWKEYFLEFLMIFLAVTLGFFAESYRVNLADRKKEKEIITSLQNDLKKDTAALNQIIAYVPLYDSWVDSAHDYIDSLPLKGNERKISKAIFNATIWAVYVPPEISLDFFKNSGDLLNNQKAKTEILKYNSIINGYVKYSEFVEGAEHSVDTSQALLFDRKLFRKLNAAVSLHVENNYYAPFINNSDVPDTVVFKTYNKAAFINVLQKLDEVDFLINDMLTSYKIILEEDANLLKVLKDEYHLKS